MGMTVESRGIKSAAELAIVTPLGIQERVKAPHDLTDEETEFWVSVVNAEPADHFTASTVPLLVQYCRHSVESRRVSELKERAFAQKDFAMYERLLQAQARESAALAMLATKMRIAQQSTINQRGNKKAPGRTKLWD